MIFFTHNTLPTDVRESISHCNFLFHYYFSHFSHVLVLAYKIVICDAPLFIHSWQPNTCSIKQLDNSGIKYSYYILRKSSHQLIVYMKTGGIIIFKLYPLLSISFSIQRAWPQISSSKEALNVGGFSPKNR